MSSFHNNECKRFIWAREDGAIVDGIILFILGKQGVHPLEYCPFCGFKFEP